MGMPVTWFDLNGPDPKAAAAFYTELFGWSMQAVPEHDYILIDTNSGAGIRGGIGKAEEGQPPASVFYVEDPDIDGLLAKAVSMGATVVVPVTEDMMVTFAMFADPFGNVVGLVKGDGSVQVAEGDRPPVDWFEMGSVKPERSWDFYRELFGWQISSGKGDGFVHGGVEAGSGTVLGGIGTSPSGRPHTTMYAAVKELPPYLERVESLGGAILMPATQVDDKTRIAVIQDPQGTMFGLYAYQP